MGLQPNNNKPLPKHLIQYWSERVEREFGEKLNDHETENHEYILNVAQENTKSFYKKLGIEEEYKYLVKLSKTIKRYMDEYQKITNQVQYKLDNISKIRKWPTTNVYTTFNPNIKMNWAHQDIEDYLRARCMDESQKAFHSSKKGKPIRQIRESKDAILDSLHSGNMSEETLRYMKSHFVKNGISPNGILNSTKSIERK
jgi:hypothetical protein